MTKTSLHFLSHVKINTSPKICSISCLLLSLLFFFVHVVVVIQFQTHIPVPKIDVLASVSTSFCLQTASERIHPDDIPKETLNPRSQYFGLIYKDTYGKPILSETNRDIFYEKYTQGIPKWITFFRDLTVSLKKYAEYNPEHVASKFTSKRSFFTGSKSEPTYKVGEIFEAKIQAVDFIGEKKKFGGDQFSARLIAISTTKKEFSDGIPCNIKDHMDGTYTISAPLPVVGKFRVDVILCASVEAVAGYVDWTTGRIHQGLTFNAQLESSEIVSCNMDLLLYDKYKNKTICDYSNPRNEESYFCEQPKSGKCDPITYIDFKGYLANVRSNFRNPFDIISQLSYKYKIYQSINGTASIINVFSMRNESNEDVFRRIQSAIDTGKYYRSSSTAESTGMGYDGHWISFVRSYKRPEKEELAKCFSNKTVYMLGDSTMRQFFYFVASEFGLEVEEKGSRHFRYVPRSGRHEKLNISVYYRSHGLPIAHVGPPNLSPYLTDVINEMVGGRNVAIILNLGIHLVSYDPAFYIHRLISIKKALECHLEKFPDTIVIIKGMNVARIPSLPFEWLVNRYNTIMREIFRDIKSSVYIHLLDMTTLWPLKINYHPAKSLIREQAYLMFSYICDKK